MDHSLTADSHTTLDQLKGVAAKFCSERDWDQFHSPKDLAIGAATESSELLELFRFKSQQEIDQLMKQPAFRARVEQELADVLFFLVRFSHKNSMDLTRAFQNKMAANALKYPVDKFKGRNDKYNEVP